MFSELAPLQLGLEPKRQETIKREQTMSETLATVGLPNRLTDWSTSVDHNA